MSIGLGPYLRLVSLGIVSNACPACDEIHRIALGAGQDWDHEMNRPTFSKKVSQSNGCRYFITMGCIEFAEDCDHAMAGRVVQLPVYPLRLP